MNAIESKAGSLVVVKSHERDGLDVGVPGGKVAFALTGLISSFSF